MTRVAVIGVGQQGQRHAELLSSANVMELTRVVDTNPERAASGSRQWRVPFVLHHTTELQSFDAAVIAIPTTDHFEVASDLIRAGKHVLIEKPVTATIEEAERLNELAEKQGVIAHVGFPERFNPVLEQVLPALTKPLFVEAHRLGVFTPRSLDVDVVLDLMIHDLDLLWLFLKEEPLQIEAVGIPILSRQIDIANARLKFPGKCVVNITASRVSAQKMRKMRLFQPYSYISLDFNLQAFTQYSLEPNLCNAGFPEIRKKEYAPQAQQHALLRELRAFADAIAAKPSAGVSVRDAIPSLKMALAIKGSFTDSTLP